MNNYTSEIKNSTKVEDMQNVLSRLNVINKGLESLNKFLKNIDS